MSTMEQLIKKYYDISLATLPIQDYISCDRDALMRAVSLSVHTYVSMSPPYSEDIFIKYVLPLRVNDEPLEYNRIFFNELLHARVLGMSAHDTALEVNLWCAENAAYTGTDDTTQSALAVYRGAQGRCGEEVTLLVCALRAVGVPARQCYAPFWSHCDDNHAWVEVFVDGDWHYMGACEPEPCLGRGWFTHAASRALFVRARALVGREHGVFDTVSVTDRYAECSPLTVYVTYKGAVSPGAVVRVCTVNYCRVRTVTSGVCDEHGKCVFNLGRGDVMLFADAKDHMACAAASVGCTQNVTLELIAFSSLPTTHFTLRPPTGHLSTHPHTNSADFDVKLQRAHTLLARKNEGFYSVSHAIEVCQKYGEYAECFAKYLHSCRGNHAELLTFFDSQLSSEHKLQILSTLRTKDLWNVRATTLSDAAQSFAYASFWKSDMFAHNILCPRVADENLSPHRGGILEFFASRNVCFCSGADVFTYMQSHMRIECERSYPGLVCNHIDSLTSGITTTFSLPILFVAICRTFGIPARLRTLDGVAEYWQDGIFVPAFGGAVCSVVSLKNDGRHMAYGVDFTLSRLSHGEFYDISLPYSLDGDMQIMLPEGDYSATCSARQIDGTTTGSLVFFTAKYGKSTDVFLSTPPDLSIQKLLHLPIINTELRGDDVRTHSLSTLITSNTILAWCEPGAEPTEHFLSELLEHETVLTKNDIHVFLITDSTNRLTKHPLALSLPFVHMYRATDIEHIDAMRTQMGIGDLRLPFITAVTKTHECLFSFANYNVGTVQSLINLF